MGSPTWSAGAACLVLWCTYVSVCGSPVPGSIISKNISEAIAELAADCITNPLLTVKAESLAVCDNPPDLKVRLKCLSFLDVNRRLCALNSIAGFNLTERLRVEGAKPLTVDTLCNNEKAFTFAALPEFPEYEKSIKKALMVPSHCVTMCSSDVFLDDSPNYFCKTLYYGSVIIQNVRAEIENTVKDEKPLKMDELASVKQVVASTPDQAKSAAEQASKVATSDIDPKVKDDAQSIKIEESGKPPELHGNTAGSESVVLAPNQNSQITGNKVDTILSPVESDPLSTKLNEQKLPNVQDDKPPETVELKPPTAEKELSDLDVHKQPPKNTDTLVETKPTVKTASSPGKPIDPAVSVDKPDIGLGPDQDDYGFSHGIFHQMPAFQVMFEGIQRPQNKEYQHYSIHSIVGPALSTSSVSEVNYTQPQNRWQIKEKNSKTTERKPVPALQIITLTGLRTVDEMQLKEYQHDFLIPVVESAMSKMSTVSNVESTKVHHLQQSNEDTFRTNEIIATTISLVLYNHTINSLAQIGNTPKAVTLNSEDPNDQRMSKWRDSQLPGIDDTPLLEDGNADGEERPIKKADTSLPERNERQFVSNIGPDDYMDDEDGHFFPLFFSAVVMMALLYILYHNKNKIMGLLIEGRQAGGRRRNSRGHSYRRLDTLEQAISSNAPGVAPSKIIY